MKIIMTPKPQRNHLILKDLMFPVRGKMNAYIDENDIHWVIEIFSQTDDPFSANLTALSFDDLKNANFSLLSKQFSFQFDKCNNFFFSCGGELIDIDSLNINFTKDESLPFNKWLFFASGTIDAMAQPDYMYNLHCETLVEIEFSYFQCSKSQSIEDDIQKIKKLTGIHSDIEYSHADGDGTMIYLWGKSLT